VRSEAWSEIAEDEMNDVQKVLDWEISCKFVMASKIHRISMFEEKFLADISKCLHNVWARPRKRLDSSER
jgi:hypothetical protein